MCHRGGQRKLGIARLLQFLLKFAHPLYQVQVALGISLILVVGQVRAAIIDYLAQACWLKRFLLVDETHCGKHRGGVDGIATSPQEGLLVLLDRHAVQLDGFADSAGAKWYQATLIGDTE